MGQLEAAAAQERAHPGQRPQRPELAEGAPVALSEGEPMHLDPGRFEARIDARLRRSGDHRLPAVPGQPERELRDVLGHSSVGGLEREEDAAHAAAVYRRAASLPPMSVAHDEQASRRDESGLEQVHQLSPWMRFRKGTVFGNMLAAAHRMRRAPRTAWRARRAAGADRARPTPAVAGRERYRAVYLIPAGPGDWEPLRDTLASVLHYEGDEAKAVVVDDASTDCRRAVVQDRFPQVDVVSRPWPSGGPPNNYPVVAGGASFALRRYSFDLLVKMDTDALVTGSSPSLAAAELFERRPRIGMAGTIGIRFDGLAENYEWDRWTLRHTERWSRGARRMMRRARAGGYDGTKVHGGIYAVSRRALEAAAAAGDLDWRSPWWSPLGEDFWLSMVVLANGYELGSLGGPGEPFAVASKYTPIEKERVAADGVLAIHSVRRGAAGEDEKSLRSFFRAARAAQPRSEATGEATDSSLPPGR